MEVLVVDDDCGIRETLVDILAVAGIAAEAAASAADGLARQRASAPSLAVVDYRLPDATGLELAAQLKEADPLLPVIVLTGNASLESAVAAVGQVDEYLTKPVRPEALLRAVRSRLERRQLEQENRDLFARLEEANATLEARVRVRTRQFRDLLESAPDAMVIVDEGGRIVRVNRQAELLFGWTRRQLVGQLVETLLPERLRAAHWAHRSGFHLQPEARAMGSALDLTARRADGSEVPVEVSLSPVQTEGGTLISAAIRDITDRKRTEAALVHQALHDALTGLPNRTLLVDRLEQALAGTVRSGGRVAVLFLDVDRFKLLNDSRGHAAGDQLLVSLAGRLREAIRPTDTVARFGGDEFVVVCPEAGTVREAMQVADRVWTAVRDPFPVGGEDVFLTVSMGIASSAGTTRAEALLRDADAAMYRAKEQGRARCEFFDETMRTEAAARLEMQNDLHRAVDRNEMHLHYQPLVDLASNVTAGVEALVRWNHPTRGQIGPASFIPLAEESGLIIPIGASVLHRAIADLAQWRHEPGHPWTVAVNLSGRQLRHPGLADQVRSALDAHELPPSALCLELTESVLMEDVERQMETLRELRAAGVRLAIDDFGTGYSSLTYLKRFPVDIVKIDRSFVTGLGSDPSDVAIVRSIVELAHALGLLVVAEGVEREEQLHVLRTLGCDLAQGYLFTPPQPLATLRETIARGYGDQGHTRHLQAHIASRGA